MHVALSMINVRAFMAFTFSIANVATLFSKVLNNYISDPSSLSLSAHSNHEITQMISLIAPHQITSNLLLQEKLVTNSIFGKEEAIFISSFLSSIMRNICPIEPILIPLIPSPYGIL
jgi:hypothetical protein